MLTFYGYVRFLCPEVGNTLRMIGICDRIQALIKFDLGFSGQVDIHPIKKAK